MSKKDLGEDEARFQPGDLVSYYEFISHYYGEGSVKAKGRGIVLETIPCTWNRQKREWLMSASYYRRFKRFESMRYKILCLKTGRRIVLGGKALILISKAGE